MRKIGKLVVILVALFSAGAANAERWQFTAAPALDFAFKKSDSLFTAFGSPWNVRWTGSPSYTSFVPSLGVSYGPIYGAISYDNPLAAWNSVTMGSINTTFQHDTYTRKEAAATIGYRLPWSVNVFAGFVHGRSDQTSILYDVALGTVSPAYFTFDERGFYVGASYSHTFGEKGTLTANVAAGKMAGEMSLNYAFPSELDILTSNSPGYSIGLNWTGPIAGSMVYRVGMKVTQYNFNFDNIMSNTGGGWSGGPIPSDVFKLEETIYSFTIGLSNYF